MSSIAHVTAFWKINWNVEDLDRRTSVAPIDEGTYCGNVYSHLSVTYL